MEADRVHRQACRNGDRRDAQRGLAGSQKGQDALAAALGDRRSGRVHKYKFSHFTGVNQGLWSRSGASTDSVAGTGSARA